MKKNLVESSPALIEVRRSAVMVTEDDDSGGYEVTESRTTARGSAVEVVARFEKREREKKGGCDDDGSQMVLVAEGVDGFRRAAARWLRKWQRLDGAVNGNGGSSALRKGKDGCGVGRFRRWQRLDDAVQGAARWFGDGGEGRR
ncbi:hypothetical protein PIB30_062176 [Stylosanthes scabra]|uniref:Uncharacterized protein n=1 Tax=Stylosanthes scabra TaxID=79078 RepID=A0ABU6QKY8_9FABA|nr:hypothetical protein [Stylosanthes scabra]